MLSKLPKPSYTAVRASNVEATMPSPPSTVWILAVTGPIMAAVNFEATIPEESTRLRPAATTVMPAIVPVAWPGLVGEGMGS